MKRRFQAGLTGNSGQSGRTVSASVRSLPSVNRAGLTLIEILTVVAIVGVLFSITIGAIIPYATGAAKQAQSASNLRQLATATHLYLNEHDDAFFPYRKETEDGVVWFFGKERYDGPAGEGNRELDRSKGPLHPYLQQVGGVEICPGFDYGNALWKPKFQGASWGYGYNLSLGPRPPIYRGFEQIQRPGKRLSDLDNPSRVIVFGTCAQVNTFQSPASPDNPMLEEFYFIDDTHRSIHFRFGGGEVALFTFADGSVRTMEPHPGTIDERLPEARVGRVTPRGSRKFLE